MPEFNWLSSILECSYQNLETLHQYIHIILFSLVSMLFIPWGSSFGSLQYFFLFLFLLPESWSWYLLWLLINSSLVEHILSILFLDRIRQLHQNSEIIVQIRWIESPKYWGHVKLGVVYQLHELLPSQPGCLQRMCKGLQEVPWYFYWIVHILLLLQQQ